VRKFALLLPLLCIAFFTGAQTKVLKSYSPEKSPAPAPSTYSAPVTYSAPANTSAAETPAEAEARRKAAIAKVQGAAAQPALSAKGAPPATYSTENTEPVTYSSDPSVPATTMVVNGSAVQRTVTKGNGQVGDDLFTPVSELHFVQFAVYCRDTPVDKAPSISGLYLLWHPGSNCPGGAKGASYIVKGYATPEEAKSAVFDYKAKGIDCWYNPALSGAEVEIIGIR
jgi:hypothetical protein